MCVDPLTASLVGCSAGVCLAWNGKRLMRKGVGDSKGWPAASFLEVKEILYFSRLIQAAYVNNLREMPERVDFIKISQVLEFSNHPLGRKNDSMCPPHFVYLNMERKEICICVRGMRMNSPTDYWTLVANRRGEKKFMEGFVHRGIFDAADWLLEKTRDCLRSVLEKLEGFSVVVVGHSLGAGIACILAMRLAEECEVNFSLSRERVKCFAFAPPRVMSLNLAVRFADVISSVVLQDDFWPRVSTSMVAKIFISSMCMLQFVLLSRMIKDIVISDKARLRDKKRLYPPGTLFHIVSQEASQCGFRSPYKVLTANPNGPRFEKLVLSLSVASDHRIRAYEKALSEVNDNNCASVEDDSLAM